MRCLLSAAQRSKKLINDHLIHLVIESELHNDLKLDIYWKVSSFRPLCGKDASQVWAHVMSKARTKTASNYIEAI